MAKGKRKIGRQKRRKEREEGNRRQFLYIM
jgi:hypothetical protein